MEYNRYKMKKGEILLGVLTGFTAAALAAVLLYRSVYGMFTAVIFVPILLGREKKRKKREQEERLLTEFKDAMQSVVAALQAGYSLENAWKESEKEMTELYGTNACMVQELHQMNLAVAMNQPLEKLFYEFADRSGKEDIQGFAEVFLFAKRSGGNLSKIIQETTDRICDKIEVEREIQTIIAAKKMEQGIMNVIPVLMLGYLNLTAKDFLEPLYGNLFGVCVMTIALVCYLGAIFLASRITDIKV